MPKNSRQIGARAERDLAALLREYGFEARRGQQFKGTKDSPDIEHDLEGFYIECKKRESFSLNDIYETLAQAQHEADLDDDALVFFTKNRRPWLAIMDGRRFLALMQEVYYGPEEETDPPGTD